MLIHNYWHLNSTLEQVYNKFKPQQKLHQMQRKKQEPKEKRKVARP